MSRPAVDWDGLEPHYRAGIRSLMANGAAVRAAIEAKT